MRTLSRVLLAFSLVVGMVAIPVFAFRFDGVRRLAAARHALLETGEAIDVVGALLAAIDEVQLVPLGFWALDPGRAELRLEYDDGSVELARPGTSGRELSFRPAELMPHGAAWLTWRPVTEDPGLGPPISGCGNGNRRGRVPFRATRRPDGRVGVQVTITEERGLEFVGADWKVPSVDGLPL